MSSPYPQFDRPQASESSQPDGDATTTASHHKGLTHTSIALICAFVVCFSFFLYLSSKAPRVSEPVRASTTRPRRSAPRQPKPKLWDVWLDEDPLDDLKPPGRTVCNWHPLAAWADDTSTSEVSRESSLHTEMMMRPHVAIAQAWCRGAYSFNPERSATNQFTAPTPPAPPPTSDPRMLNVAVLVAMPSRRKFTLPVSRSAPHPAIESGLPFDEGHLVMGVTSLPYDEQATCTAPKEDE